MPPPPMVPGKHNMDIGTWDSPKNGPALVPPPLPLPVPIPMPVSDEPSPLSNSHPLNQKHHHQHQQQQQQTPQFTGPPRSGDRIEGDFRVSAGLLSRHDRERPDIFPRHNPGPPLPPVGGISRQPTPSAVPAWSTQPQQPPPQQQHQQSTIQRAALPSMPMVAPPVSQGQLAHSQPPHPQSGSQDVHGSGPMSRSPPQPTMQQQSSLFGRGGGSSTTNYREQYVGPQRDQHSHQQQYYGDREREPRSNNQNYNDERREHYRERPLQPLIRSTLGSSTRAATTSPPPQPQPQKQQQQHQQHRSVEPSFVKSQPQPLLSTSTTTPDFGGSNTSTTSSLDHPVLEELCVKNQYNPQDFDFDTCPAARFFVIKSYSEDDIHRSIKYEIWCSTDHGNRRLDQAFHEREKAPGGVVYLLFSVNGSGHFCGVAQMLTAVDYNTVSSVWSQSKWKGSFKVKWIYVKDVPNTHVRHIRLENNENKSVTHSRDTQEVPNAQGILVLEIISTYKHVTSIFDDFVHYEKRQEEEDTKKVVHVSDYDKYGGGGGGGYDRGGSYGGGFDRNKGYGGAGECG